MPNVPAPKFEDAPVEPFSKEEIEKLLKACDYSREAETDRRRKFTMQRVTAHRDRALMLVLLDTGLRASELAALKIGDYDNVTGKVAVRHGLLGGAKGGKGRFVYLGKSARRSLWRYLADRPDNKDSAAPLFLGRYDRPITRNASKTSVRAGRQQTIA